MTARDETERLEALWSGEFGNEYSKRNAEAERGRQAFWVELLAALRPVSVLEVGCNVGGNLRWITESVRGGVVAGVDVNLGALRDLHARIPSARSIAGAGRHLPIADRAFDLVFTMGVLIHQPTESLSQVMSEVVRCSSRLVVCGEYHENEPTEVRYRGVHGALWKRDYGAEYLRLFPELSLLSRGFLAKGEGSWDDVTWWAFEKR